MRMFKKYYSLLTCLLLISLPIAPLHADETKADQLLQEGKQSLVWGQTTKAEIKLLLAKREAPARSDIVAQLVEVYLIQKEYNKGLQLVDELIKTNANEPEPHLLKGRLLQHQGNMQAAQASYINAAGYAADDPKVLAEVGGFFLLIGDAVQAETYSQRVKALQNK